MKLVLLKSLVCCFVFTPLVLSYKYRRERDANERLTLGQSGTIRSLESNTSVQDEVASGSVAIRFQHEDNIIYEGKYRMKGVPSCASISGNDGFYDAFCTDDREYNATIEKKFNEIMKNKPVYSLYSDVLNETVVAVDNDLSVHLRQRVGFNSEEPLCTSVETIIYPKRGQTPSKDWVFILNQGHIQQGVKVEKCLHPNTQCKLGGGPIDQTSCRQKYIYKKLLTMDTAGNNIVSESIYMPSCCVCYATTSATTRSASGGAAGIPGNVASPKLS